MWLMNKQWYALDIYISEVDFPTWQEIAAENPVKNEKKMHAVSDGLWYKYWF